MVVVKHAGFVNVQTIATTVIFLGKGRAQMTQQSMKQKAVMTNVNHLNLSTTLK